MALTAHAPAVEAAGQVLRAACAQVDDLGDFVRRVAQRDWSGLAADAYRARAAEIGRRADAQSLVLRQAATALDAHAERIARGDDAGLAAQELRHHLYRLRPDGTSGWRSALGDPDPADHALLRCPRTGSAEDIRSWWDGLSSAEREGAVVAAPGLVGRLDGLPGAVRSIANRVAVTRDVAAGQWRERNGVLSDAEHDRLDHAEDAAEALGDLARRGLPSQLYLYDPIAFDRDGRVAIGVGDLDSADHIAVVVPGFGNDASDIGPLSERAANLAEAAGHFAADDSTAVLAWIGYDAPDNVLPWGSDRDALAVATADSAESGAVRVDALVDGLRAADNNERVHLTVIGHSYGSTTVGLAADDHHLDVDDLVVLGSPGLGPGVDHATDLGVGRGHVWVGANSSDPVAQLGDVGWVHPGRLGLGLGSNPASEEFGAQRFWAETAGTNAGPIDHTLRPIEAHTTYLDHDTESLRNIGLIVTGLGDQVQLAQPVSDSWRSEPVDPEASREPTSPSTR